MRTKKSRTTKYDEPPKKHNAFLWWPFLVAALLGGVGRENKHDTFLSHQHDASININTHTYEAMFGQSRHRIGAPSLLRLCFHSLSLLLLNKSGP